MTDTSVIHGIEYPIKSEKIPSDSLQAAPQAPDR